jgi:hypothetical protein
MNELYWAHITREKDLHRLKLADLPFDEKLLVLERLREQSRAIRGMWKPVRSEQLTSTSDISITATGPAQTANSSIRLDLSGANATLVAAMVGMAAPTLISVSATPIAPERK